MTSLPITLPHGFTSTVKVNDVVKSGQVIATPPDSRSPDFVPPPANDEYVVDLPKIYATKIGSVGKLLKTTPGENLMVGDVIASRSSGLGFKKEEVLVKIPGIVTRYERDTGRIIIRKSEKDSPSVTIVANTEPILAPIDGKVTVCNNSQIVIEGKTSEMAGVKGVGPKVTGELVIIPTQDGDPVESRLITSEMIGKILLVPNMTRDALVKASAIGVVGVIGISIVQEDLDYLTLKKLDLTVLDIEKDVAKKVKDKEGKQIVVDGAEKLVLLS